MRRVLSVYLPDWPIQRRLRRWKRGAVNQKPRGHADRREPQPPASPAVLLVTQARGRQVVAYGCGRAKRAGVRPGMTLAHARALLPADTLVLGHEPAVDEQALMTLARWAVRFTPIVAADPPAGLLLDVTGCERLYGGEQRLLRQLGAALRELNLRGQAVIAPTLGAAWALARYGGARPAIIMDDDDLPAMLAPLPVAALRLAAEAVEAMGEVGIERVGELLGIEREALAERFEPTVLRRVDQALGRVDEGVEPLRPPSPVRVSRAFGGPVKQLEAVMIATRELVEALCEQLAHREAGVRQLVVTVERADTHHLHETLRLARPSRSVKHLWALLRPRVERWHLGFGVERITLEAMTCGRLAHHQSAAWARLPEATPPEPAWNATAAELVDQLAERLGRDRVLGMAPSATYVPERAFTALPLTANMPAPEDTATGLDADRPTRLLPRPEPVRVTLLAPEGPVMQVHEETGQAWRVLTSIGPERIAPRWWLAAPHGAPLPRDYYQVQDEHGRWWWLYRQANTHRWFIHGRWC